MVVQPVICSVLVGRSHELDALRAARRSLAQSRGSFVLIGGDPGIGKTRLVSQFLGEVERQPRRRFLATSECLEFTMRPYGAFRELYDKLDLSFPWMGDREMLERREIFQRVVDDLRVLAESRATILVIEDLQWADESTLELLSFLVPRLRTTRLLTIVTYRSNALAENASLAGAIARLSREPTTFRIDLEPLDSSETRELLEHAHGRRRPVGSSVLESVAQRSEGNPFFAEELLKDALEDRRGGDEAIPFTIRASVTERLDSLSDSDRTLLSGAAVLGYRFDPNVLAMTMETSIDAVLPALRRARDLNVLVEDTRADGRFRFRHALTREVVYDAALRFDTRRTHERILATLESLPDADRRIDTLAYHAWAARDRSKTVAYNLRAGEIALGLRALDEARVAYERVLETVDRGGCDEAVALEALGTIAEMQGRIAAAFDLLDAASECYLRNEDFDGAANARRAACAARNNLGDPRALEDGRAFLARHRERLGAVAKGSLLSLLARLVTVGRIDPTAMRGMLAEIETCGPLPARARQNELVARMDLAVFDGDADGWQRMVPELLGIQHDLPPFVSAISLVALAQRASQTGFSAIADDAFARAGRLERDWGFEGLATYAAAARAQHAFLYGRVEETRATIAEARRGPEVAVASMALALVAPHAAIAFEEPSLMTPELERCFEATRGEAASVDDALILCGSAAWSVSKGRLAEARADLRLAITCMPRVLAPLGTLLALAATHLEEPDLERVRALLRDELHPSDRAGRANLRLAEAVLARRAGRLEAATAEGREAARAFAALGWPFLEMRALLVCGERDEAHEIAARLGLEPAVSQAERLPQSLTKREEDIVRRIAIGATNAEIAMRLGISRSTVEKHVTTVFQKLDVKRRSQIAARFGRLGDERLQTTRG